MFHIEVEHVSGTSDRKDVGDHEIQVIEKNGEPNLNRR